MRKLTWNELADIYDKQTHKHARTQKMDDIAEWAEKQTDKFVIDEEGYIWLIEETK